MEKVQQELAEFKGAKQEREEVQQELKDIRQEHTGTQQELSRTQQELSRTQQELSRTQKELKEMQQEHTVMQQELSRTQQELEGAQQELEEASSAVQKLTYSLSAEKEKCLVAHHANQKVTYVYIIFIATLWQVYAWLPTYPLLSPSSLPPPMTPLSNCAKGLLCRQMVK